MNRDLFLRLVLPLLGAFVATLLLSSFLNGALDASNLLLNLSAGFLDILVTVLYVDWVLKSHEQRQWKIARERINKQVGYFALETAQKVSMALGFQDELAHGLREPLARMNIEEIEGAILATIEHVVCERVIEQAGSLTPEQWKNVLDNVQLSLNESNRILDLFSNRLPPQTSQILLELQEMFSKIKSGHELTIIMPLLAESLLPKGLGSDRSKTATALAKKVLGENISIMLKKCIELTKTVGYSLKMAA